MTEFKTHSGMGLKLTGAHVVPDKTEDQTLAEKVVFQAEDVGEVTYKPRYTEEVTQTVDGIPTRHEKSRKYPIKQLPDDLKELVKKLQDEDLTVTATVGEAINGDNSSYFISQGDLDTVKPQETLFSGGDSDE